MRVMAAAEFSLGLFLLRTWDISAILLNVISDGSHYICLERNGKERSCFSIRMLSFHILLNDWIILHHCYFSILYMYCFSAWYCEAKWCTTESVKQIIENSCAALSYSDTHGHTYTCLYSVWVVGKLSNKIKPINQQSSQQMSKFKKIFPNLQ